MDCDQLKTIQSQIVCERLKIQDINKTISNLIVKDEPLLENKLKGDQLTGFLGEYYASKLITEVEIEPSEKNSYDLFDDLRRIEVKTRVFNSKRSSNWRQTSAISEKIILPNGPTHLCFVLLNENYSIHGVWLFDWQYLLNTERFKHKVVKGNPRAYYFMLRYSKDNEFRIY